MKSFWKLILILWALTYSPAPSDKETSNPVCEACMGMSEKTTQTCDACPAAKDSSVT